MILDEEEFQKGMQRDINARMAKVMSARAPSEAAVPAQRVPTGEGLAAALKQREGYARKVKMLIAQTRYVAKALALAEARLEAADEIVAAMKAANIATQTRPAEPLQP
jgi:hypothetical protein